MPGEEQGTHGSVVPTPNPTGMGGRAQMSPQGGDKAGPPSPSPYATMPKMAAGPSPAAILLPHSREPGPMAGGGPPTSRAGGGVARPFRRGAGTRWWVPMAARSGLAAPSAAHRRHPGPGSLPAAIPLRFCSSARRRRAHFGAGGRRGALMGEMVWDGSRAALLSAASVGIPSERASSIAACRAAFNGGILLKLRWEGGCVLPTGNY